MKPETIPMTMVPAALEAALDDTERVNVAI
jgi:hypothetical protein